MSRETESMFKALHKYLDENSDENRTEDDNRFLFVTMYAYMEWALDQTSKLR